MKICEIEGCNNSVFSKGKCKFHQIRNPIKKKSFIKKKVKINVEKNQQMKDFFLEIWNTRPHVSEISGEGIYGDFSSVYMHHILYKKKYPEAMYDSENIIILAASEHQSVHIIPDKYEEIKRRKELLLIKYNKS